MPAERPSPGEPHGRGERPRSLWPLVSAGLALGGVEVAIMREAHLGLGLQASALYLLTACIAWALLLAGLGFALRWLILRGLKINIPHLPWPGRRLARGGLLILLASVLVSAERGRPPIPPLDRGAEHGSRAPDVVFLSVEHPRPQELLGSDSAPTLQRLQREGALLDGMQTTPGGTEIALLSLMTGQAEPGAGQPALGRAAALGCSRHTSSLIELLQGDGYLSGGFSAAPLLPSLSAWGRAFDLFDPRAGGIPGLSRPILLRPLLSPSYPYAQSGARATVRAQAFYERALDHRLLLWLHLPETSYDVERFEEDALVGRILQSIEARGWLDETLLLVALLPSTPDTQTQGVAPRAKVLLRHPSSVRAGLRVSCPVELKDIKPTVADVLGSRNRELGGGRSLLSALNGGPCPTTVAPDRNPAPMRQHDPREPQGPRPGSRAP